MTNLFKDYSAFVKVYLDDVIIHSKNAEEHLRHLDLVFERLRKYSFYTKLRKCKFLKDRIVFLGHEIDASGVHIAQDKVRSVMEWSVPTS